MSRVSSENLTWSATFPTIITFKFLDKIQLIAFLETYEKEINKFACVYAVYISRSSCVEKADQSRHLLQREVHDRTPLKWRADKWWKPVRQNDGVAVVVENVDNGVRLNESSYFAKHKAPLQLVFRFICGRVLIWKRTISPFALGANLWQLIIIFDKK